MEQFKKFMIGFGKGLLFMIALLVGYGSLMLFVALVSPYVGAIGGLFLGLSLLIAVVAGLANV